MPIYTYIPIYPYIFLYIPVWGLLLGSLFELKVDRGVYFGGAGPHQGTLSEGFQPRTAVKGKWLRTGS